MGFSRQEYWSGLPFPSPVDHILSYLSTMTRPSWVAPGAWLNFIELDKAVVLVWLDWLVFCEYGFSLFALWCPLATPTVLLGFLLPWGWGISSWLLQQSAAIAPYLGRGVSPHRRPSWPSTWDSSSRPSCTRTATAPWTWGWSWVDNFIYLCHIWSWVLIHPCIIFSRETEPVQYLSIYLYLTIYLYIDIDIEKERERTRRYLLLELAQVIMETKSHSLLSAIENQENQCYDWILFQRTENQRNLWCDSKCEVKGLRNRGP